MNTMKICIFGPSKEIILHKEMMRLPLRESEVIAKSIEYFRDPEPCMLHRSAVMERMYLEIIQYFEKSLQGGQTNVSWNEIPLELRKMLDVNGNICSVRVILGEP
jgi:hypothetical protein